MSTSIHVPVAMKRSLFLLLLPTVKFLLKDKIPRLVKRQILLISAAAVVAKIDKPSNNLIVSLSKCLHTKSSVTGAAFLLKDYTWKSIGSNGICLDQCVIPFENIKTDCVKEVDSELVAGYFADRVPSWLAYGSRELIVDDLKRTFAAISAIKSDKFNTAENIFNTSATTGSILI